MHILTKVFVLIASVLSIMMASLAISYSVNADKITEGFHDARAAADTAQADQAAQKAAHGQERATLQEDLNAKQDELASRDADTRRLEASNSELRIALRQAEAGRESITSKISQLGVTTETQAKIIAEYKTELSRLREDQLNYRDEKIDLEKSISDLESQAIVFEQVNRALRESITSLQNMANGGNPNGNARDNTPREADRLVRGTIDEVLNDSNTGDTIVKVNLGTNDQIVENTRLYIHRGTDIYLGELIIFSADLNHAVGRIDLKVANYTIRAGDQVTSKLGG